MNRVTAFLTDWPLELTTVSATALCKGSQFDDLTPGQESLTPISGFLERLDGLPGVGLQFDGGAAIRDESNRLVPVCITLHSPHALRALIALLTELEAKAAGTSILTAMQEES